MVNKTSKRVLISGAGIAGTTAGYWLHRAGIQVTIVERAKDLRNSGHAVEVSAEAAKIVARAMGIEAAIRAKGTTEEGLVFVDDKGRTLSRMPVDRVRGRSFTSEAEILRGELAQILYEVTESLVEYRFDEYITEIHQDSDAVDIVFKSGKKESFDYLVICDGLHSKARKLAGFDAENVEIVPFHLGTALFTINDEIIDIEDKFAKWYPTDGRRHMMLRPDATGKNTRGYFTYTIDEPLDRSLSIEQQKALVTAKFQGCGYVVDQVLKGMNRSASDFYMTDIAQVKAKSWSRGRVVLCGDAAYCPSPMSGSGVDCAMVGAYVLAGELAKQQHHETAFKSYQKTLAPFIDDAQSINPKFVQMLYPSSQWGTTVLRTIIWLTWASGLLWALQKFPDIPYLSSKPYATPDYSHYWQKDDSSDLVNSN